MKFIVVRAGVVISSMFGGLVLLVSSTLVAKRLFSVSASSIFNQADQLLCILGNVKRSTRQLLLHRFGIS